MHLSMNFVCSVCARVCVYLCGWLVGWAGGWERGRKGETETGGKGGKRERKHLSMRHAGFGVVSLSCTNSERSTLLLNVRYTEGQKLLEVMMKPCRRSGHLSPARNQRMDSARFSPAISIM